jgi:hypothetical protein
MGIISKDTLKRIYLLYLIGEFQEGPYGKLRLEKVTYLSERKAEKKPFGFKWYNFGQYSEDLSNTLEQLISMGYVASYPLESKEEGKEGNIYISQVKENNKEYGEILSAVGLGEDIKKAVEEWGYDAESDIIEKAYNLKEVKNLDHGDVIFEGNLPDYFEILYLDEEYCEDIELSFNPRFIASMEKVVKGYRKSDFDIEKVKKVDAVI